MNDTEFIDKMEEADIYDGCREMSEEDSDRLIGIARYSIKDAEDYSRFNERSKAKVERYEKALKEIIRIKNNIPHGKDVPDLIASEALEVSNE